MARHGVNLIEIDWDLQIRVSPKWRFMAFLNHGMYVPVTISRPLVHSVVPRP